MVKGNKWLMARGKIFLIMLVLLSGLNVNYKILFGNSDFLGIATIYFIYFIRLCVSLYAIKILINCKLCEMSIKFLLYFLCIFIFNTFSVVFGTGGGLQEWIHRTLSMCYLFLYYICIIRFAREDEDNLLIAMYYIAMFLLLDSLLWYYVEPEIATYCQSEGVYTLQGVAGGRNQIIEYWILGTMGFMASETLRRKKANWLLWVIGTYVQYLTQSGTGLVIMVCIICLWIVLKFQKKLIRNALSAGYILVIIIYIVTVFQQKLMFDYIIINVLHKSPTLTGRFIIWEKSINAIKNSFIIGYGYDSNSYLLQKFQLGLPDNAIIYLLLAGGLAGILIWLIFFLDSIKGLILKNTLDLRYCCFQIGVFAYIVRGISEAVLSYPHIVFWIMLILLSENTDRHTDWRNIIEKNTRYRNDYISWRNRKISG